MTCDIGREVFLRHLMKPLGSGHAKEDTKRRERASKSNGKVVCLFIILLLVFAKLGYVDILDNYSRVFIGFENMAKALGF